MCKVSSFDKKKHGNSKYLKLNISICAPTEPQAHNNYTISRILLGLGLSGVGQNLTDNSHCGHSKQSYPLKSHSVEKTNFCKNIFIQSSNEKNNYIIRKFEI